MQLPTLMAWSRPTVDQYEDDIMLPEAALSMFEGLGPDILTLQAERWALGTTLLVNPSESSDEHCPIECVMTYVLTLAL
jgi:hypothetical protein